MNFLDSSIKEITGAPSAIVGARVAVCSYQTKRDWVTPLEVMLMWLVDYQLGSIFPPPNQPVNLGIPLQRPYNFPFHLTLVLHFSQAW